MLDVGAARPIAEPSWRCGSPDRGGPGGQHVNTSATRVELVFDLAGQPEPERRGAVLRPPPAALAAGRRGPAAGRRAGRAQPGPQPRARPGAPAELMRRALEPPPKPRRPTRPTAAAAAERLAGKRRTATRKQARRPARPRRGVIGFAG